MRYEFDTEVKYLKRTDLRTFFVVLRLFYYLRIYFFDSLQWNQLINSLLSRLCFKQNYYFRRSHTAELDWNRIGQADRIGYRKHSSDDWSSYQIFKKAKQQLQNISYRSHIIHSIDTFNTTEASKVNCILGLVQASRICVKKLAPRERLRMTAGPD